MKNITLGMATKPVRTSIANGASFTNKAFTFDELEALCSKPKVVADKLDASYFVSARKRNKYINNNGLCQ